MVICWGFGSVFEFDSVFRAEKSHNLMYLCEFIGLDLEMEIKEHYSEVMDIVDGLFVAMFDSLNEKCKKELEAIGNQYPIEPLKYLRKTLRLTFEEGVQMLKEADVEVNPLGDLNTELKRKLGKLVLEKYGSQRVHDPELLSTRAQSCGIDPKSIEAYIDAFRNGTAPHGGFGVGLERVLSSFTFLTGVSVLKGLIPSLSAAVGSWETSAS
ncbi:aspartate--tRNA ligase 2, cytoplasmic-like [Papaver somniferum]|uniref:aspartate--tRNA ligase 2, cytoplasmic-like n=1 Tax=Papaver somniferum TaxID=3469 RepID=UPI000E70152A|nr:aspartate--tRNA ligase 2, cytoplasmic-like [Papaver somniferum]